MSWAVAYCQSYTAVSLYSSMSCKTRIATSNFFTFFPLSNKILPFENKKSIRKKDPYEAVFKKSKTCNTQEKFLPHHHPVDYLSNLPVEIAEEIFSYLSFKDLLSLECVSSCTRQIILEGRLWIRLLCQNVECKPSWKRKSKYFDCSLEESVIGNIKSRYNFLKIHTTEQNILRNWNNLRFKNRKLLLDFYFSPECLQMDDVRIFLATWKSGISTATVQVYNRRTLDLEKEFIEPEGVERIILLTDDVLCYGTSSGYAKILNWSTGVLLSSVQHPRNVTDLAFSVNTIVTRSCGTHEDWSLIKIQQLSSCFTVVRKETEIFLSTVVGYGIGFDGKYLVIHTVPENAMTMKPPDAAIQIRTGDGWKVIHEITVPFEDRIGFQFTNGLVFTSHNSEIRIYDVASGLCRTKISFGSRLMLAKFAFPFVLIGLDYYNDGFGKYGFGSKSKVNIWNLTTLLSDDGKKEDFPHCAELKDFPLCEEILFDEMQIIGFTGKELFVADILSDHILHTL